MGLGRPHHVVHESVDSYVERKYTVPIIVLLFFGFIGVGLIYGGITGDMDKSAIEWGILSLLIVYLFWFRQVNRLIFRRR